MSFNAKDMTQGGQIASMRTATDENTVASLRYGKSVRIPAETVGGPERVLQ